MPLFLLIDFILKSAVGRTLFDNVRQPENIRGALQSLYSSADSVDQELVDLFYQPSCDEGAADVFISVYTGAPRMPIWGAAREVPCSGIGRESAACA